jgi:hypothetical protein
MTTHDLMTAAFYWTGVVVWACGALIVVCWLVGGTLNLMWQRFRTTRDWMWFRAAVTNYEKINPRKRKDDK